MVTAILIPIICFYFYWLTKKEMKEHEKKWLAAGEVEHEAIVKGVIKNIHSEKQRYYYNRYLYIQTLQLQTDGKSVIVKKIAPLTKDLKHDNFTIGDKVLIYGSWEGNTFKFNHYEIEETN